MSTLYSIHIFQKSKIETKEGLNLQRLWPVRIDIIAHINNIST